MDGMTPGSVDPAFRQPRLGVSGPAATAQVGVAPASVARRTYEHLPEGVGEQIQAAGGNPMHFNMVNGQLMKSLDHLDRRPGEMPPAPPVPATAAPVANVPSLGVQGAAPAPKGVAIYRGGQAPQMVRPPGAGDEARQALKDNLWSATHSSGAFDQDRSGMINRAAHSLQQYDMGESQIAANDPMKQIGVLGELAKPENRAALDVYNAGKGVGPNVIPRQPIPAGPGQPAVTVQNLDQHLGLPQNAALAGILNSPDADFLGQLRQFGQFPGAADPNHVNHQLFQAFVNRKYSASGPGSWNSDTYHTPFSNVFHHGTMNEVNSLLSRYRISSPFNAQPQ